MPIVIIAFSFMWLTEQSRLMRAGDYLQFLEYKINAELGEACITWENWLRRSGISMWDVHRIHHIAQYLIMGFFLLIAIISIWVMWILDLLNLNLRIFLTAIYLILIFILIFLMSKVIVHRTSKRETKVVEVGISAYNNWEKKFWDERPQ